MRPVSVDKDRRRATVTRRRTAQVERRYDGIAQAVYEIKVFRDITPAIVGDGAFEWAIPENLNGLKLVAAHAFVTTA